MKAIEQYFHVVLFIMLYKVVITPKSVDETLVCDSTFMWYCLSGSFFLCLWMKPYCATIQRRGIG